ncbi:response regulator [Acidimangrovimonas sediminis]|uniref:response regulator n=1 Tax=Acidimangrovimonas sediminis TaxID=2056283 RepID=UPI000C7FE47E|nr:response regulator [Acidimangrovimonas sediminis]
MKILAVDDDELILEVLVEAMSANGHEDVTTATSAEEACRKIAASAEPFELFLLDIQMPEVTGIELCRAIRRMPGHATTPIIMVTAMSERQYVTAAFAAGATDYVTKPFDALELGARIGMAERLVKEHSRAETSSYAMADLRAALEDQRKVSFAEPINIEGVDGVIGLVNLENYLLQLSRGGLFATNIFAIKLADAEKLYARTNASDFRYALADAAEAVATAVSTRDHFVAYAGGGIFVAAVHGREIESRDYFEDLANIALYEMDPADSSGARLDLRLYFGEPVRVGMLRSGSAAVEALYVAIERIEDSLRRKSVRKPQHGKAPWLKMLVG